MWGRFSGSTESTLDQDFEAIEDIEHGIERLLENLRLWRGSLRVEPAHFGGASRGDRFYPVLYALTRVGHAKDLCSGVELRRDLLGRMNVLEVHHIFPKSLLYKVGFHRSEVNAVANFSLLTKECNLEISNCPPNKYFRRAAERHPGALESQWIPMDPELWEIENYPHFLEERQRLLAAATNDLLDTLRHDSSDVGTAGVVEQATPTPVAAPGGIEDEEEEAVLRSLNEWVREQGLPEGSIEHEVALPTQVSHLPSLTWLGRTACRKALATRWRCCWARSRRFCRSRTTTVSSTTPASTRSSGMLRLKCWRWQTSPPTRRGARFPRRLPRSRPDRTPLHPRTASMNVCS